VPPTPDEAPHIPRVLPAPVSSAPALEGDVLDETMGEAAEAGPLPSRVGLQVPSTPLGGTSQAAGSALEAPSRGMDTSSGVVHPHETASEESERPAKQPRIFAVFEHEDAEHPTAFESCEVEELEFSLEDGNQK